MSQIHLIQFRLLPHYFGTYHETSQTTYKTKVIYFNSKKSARKCAKEINRFYKRRGKIPTLKNLYDMKITDNDGLSEHFLIHSIDKDYMDYTLAMSNIGSLMCTIDNNNNICIENDLHIELCSDEIGRAHV